MADSHRHFEGSYWPCQQYPGVELFGSEEECSTLFRNIGNYVETFLLPTDAHNVKKHRVIKTF